MKTLENIAIGAFSILVGSCIVLAFVLALSMLVECFTGIDVLRTYIHPLFGGLQ